MRACTPLQCLSCGHCPRGRSARVSLTHTFAASMTDAQQPGPGRRELAGRKTHQIPRHFFITSAADGAVRAGRSVQVQIRFRDEERTAPQGPARPCTYGTRFGTGTACGKGRGNRRACALPRSIGTPAAASLFDDVPRGRGYRRLLGPHRRAGPGPARVAVARPIRYVRDAHGADCYSRLPPCGVRLVEVARTYSVHDRTISLASMIISRLFCWETRLRWAYIPSLSSCSPPINRC